MNAEAEAITDINKTPKRLVFGSFPFSILSGLPCTRAGIKSDFKIQFHLPFSFSVLCHSPNTAPLFCLSYNLVLVLYDWIIINVRTNKDLLLLLPTTTTTKNYKDFDQQFFCLRNWVFVFSHRHPCSQLMLMLLISLCLSLSSDFKSKVPSFHSETHKPH